MFALTRTTITRGAVAAVAVVALAASTAVGGSSVTKARLERSLPQSFANVYVQQAAILGHRGITVGSLHARASCDKGGPKVGDVGAGADWICLMRFTDPHVPLPDGTAKFELNVHSNDCYTAGGPSKLVGLLTITDTRGRTVDNPASEWDACFDPATRSDAPTGVTFQTSAAASRTPAQQSRASATLTLPAGAMGTDPDGVLRPHITCSAGRDGCAGTITATAPGRAAATLTYALAPGDSGPIELRMPSGRTGPIRLEAAPVIGTVRGAASTVVQR